jgi:hypothetical protein
MHTIPPPPALPTIPDAHAPVSVRYGALRLTLPAVVVSALVAAGASLLMGRAAPAPRDDVAELRGDMKALQATVSALATAQRELLERINRDADAARNRELVDALRQGRPAPAP